MNDMRAVRPRDGPFKASRITGMPDKFALQVNGDVRVSLNPPAQVVNKLRRIVSFQRKSQVPRESAEPVAAFHQVDRKTLLRNGQGSGHPCNPATDNEPTLHHGIGGFQKRLQVLRSCH